MFLYCIFARLISSRTEPSHDWAIMVRTVKNLPKWNLQFSFLYFLQVFEWWCVYYVLTSSNNISSLTESGRSDLTTLSTHFVHSSMPNVVNLGAFKMQINECRSDLAILSTHFVHSSMLNFVNLGAFKIQLNECICGVPLTWNSTRNA